MDARHSIFEINNYTSLVWSSYITPSPMLTHPAFVSCLFACLFGGLWLLHLRSSLQDVLGLLPIESIDVSLVSLGGELLQVYGIHSHNQQNLAHSVWLFWLFLFLFVWRGREGCRFFGKPCNAVGGMLVRVWRNFTEWSRSRGCHHLLPRVLPISFSSVSQTLVGKFIPHSVYAVMQYWFIVIIDVCVYTFMYLCIYESKRDYRVRFSCIWLFSMFCIILPFMLMSFFIYIYILPFHLGVITSP